MTRGEKLVELYGDANKQCIHKIPREQPHSKTDPDRAIERFVLSLSTTDSI
jgi:hypothetical protein